MKKEIKWIKKKTLRNFDHINLYRIIQIKIKSTANNNIVNNNSSFYVPININSNFLFKKSKKILRTNQLIYKIIVPIMISFFVI